MLRLMETGGLTELQRDILRAVSEFVDVEIIPAVGDLDRSDSYPDQIVAGLSELGVFGLISAGHGGDHDLPERRSYWASWNSPTCSTTTCAAAAGGPA
jgi:alkylation response protein AidB-like acyl-CoA dehydrogenase